MKNVYGSEYVIRGGDIVFVHSAKLDQTMAIFLVRTPDKDGMALTGLLIRGQTPAQIRSAITKEGEPQRSEFYDIDYDKGENFSVSGEVYGQKLDYSVSVTDDGKDLKLVMLLSLLKERKQYEKINADAFGDFRGGNKSNMLRYNVIPNIKPEKTSKPDKDKKKEVPDIYYEQQQQER